MVNIGKGKYSEWITDDGLLLIEGYAREGLTDPQIAHNMGIGLRTLYDWVERFPQVSQALKRGKAPVDMEVENALLKRAMGYTEEETTTETITTATGATRTTVRTINRVYPPDVTACIFWLKNRKPKQWREKIETAVNVDVEDLSPLVELLKE